ncbi:glycoside hydrolase family 16 protein [Mixia osmundae IAM 14324]|uniref:GH16 domain-containing protein n=1 Tax=Mixia osmundae (strain CBS 9802 / IAM 14324 / JCM 22182 / KY 12970) TaxID=764103 RepID=G7DSD6_MIXOS|nr:glycoside hydrolase family 16 protein [Mixia osmundae IAM 14324]KEI38009.1 glycoside hydrolase family 16 protein [Mixia osmundae IAM 14324]GAA93496.1 hypothetical protein E5Q_00137 [Mixia osmundae IAM 14324]
MDAKCEISPSKRKMFILLAKSSQSSALYIRLFDCPTRSSACPALLAFVRARLLSPCKDPTVALRLATRWLVNTARLDSRLDHPAELIRMGTSEGSIRERKSVASPSRVVGSPIPPKKAKAGFPRRSCLTSVVRHGSYIVTRHIHSSHSADTFLLCEKNNGFTYPSIRHSFIAPGEPWTFTLIHKHISIMRFGSLLAPAAVLAVAIALSSPLSVDAKTCTKKAVEKHHHHHHHKSHHKATGSVLMAAKSHKKHKKHHKKHTKKTGLVKKCKKVTHKKHHHHASAASASTAKASTSTAATTDGSSLQNLTSTSGKSTSKGKAVSTPFKLTQSSEGSNFFDSYDFFTAADPTHGQVQFVDAATATSAKLAYVNSDGQAIIKMDDTSNLASGQARKSVRLTSKNSFTQGLLIMDAAKMPYGCGTWPAFWTVGPNWPNGGEIDIVEGVNKVATNQMTLHSSNGCNLQQPMAGTGTVLGTNCYAYANGNAGCGVKDPSTASYGAGFNAAGGGAFATLIDTTGVSIWFWSRNDIPSDVLAGTPLPSSWSQPKAHWASSGCSLSFIGPQSVVWDITANGDWDRAVFSSDGCPGSPQEFMMTGSNYANAEFAVNYVKWFEQ